MKPIALLAIMAVSLPLLYHCSTPSSEVLGELDLLDKNDSTVEIMAEDLNDFTTLTKPYDDAVLEVTAKQSEFKTLYASASKADKTIIISKAGRYLDSAVCDILFPYWKGTKWDFNGHTNVPNKGEIACGYLVSTILKHAGVNINRYKMAQQSALSEIKTISGTSGAKYLGDNSDKALEKIKQLKDGLYILGLSNHVGFIRVRKNDVRFIHSTYLEPTAAINEKAADSDAFTYSNAYYIGEISGNAAFIKKWLSGEVVRVVLD